MPDQRNTAAPSESADASSALVALAAFNGAVIGALGLVAAALNGDAVLGVVTGLGMPLCAVIWQRRLRAVRAPLWASDSGRAEE